MGFKIDESKVKRAGLDYWPSVSLNEHESLSAFRQATNDPRCWFIETCGEKFIWEAQFAPGDALVFGSETLGLSKELLRDVDPAFIIKLPMRTTAVRSLNLSNTVTAVSYEALRQNARYYL
jgi:tRNA (cytidine/uridine-2'-O-)-methyltransferase